jgi:mono/diheme cytochrome c family protein
MRSVYLLWFVLLFAPWSASVNAQGRKPVTAPSAPGSANAQEGKELFMSLCATCHGESAKGDGATAPVLKTRPADLTQLARRNNGIFPDDRVLSILKGSSNLTSHSVQEMPTWGPLLNPQGIDTADGLRKLYALVLYLAEIQPSRVSMNGKELFTNFCAACHGESGKGNGPTAAMLKTSPPDLTRLAHTNKGVFPEARVLSILRGGVILKSHGPQEMPTWGSTLRQMGADERGTEARILAVAQFVAQLQAK